jgi:hypothetical protein
MQTLLQTTRAYKLLEAELAQGKAAHAYLLLLDDERQLRFALKTFAKLFFDGDKRKQQLIDAESFTDCLFYPEEGKRFVVEDAEKIAEESALRPVEGEKKLFVIGDFAEVLPVAQNKLLKLLEEPPAGVVFLLGATTAFPVLSTVLSRVKKLEIPPFSTKDVSDCLKRTYGDNPKFTQTDFDLCAATCAGSIGGAQAMLEDGAYKQLVEDAFALCNATLGTLPQLVQKLGETKRKKQLFSLLRTVFRDTLVLKTGQTQHILLTSQKERLQKTAEKYTLSGLIAAQERIAKAETELAFNAYFPQCLEILMANIFAANK